MQICIYTRCQGLPPTFEQVVDPTALVMCRHDAKQISGRYIITHSREEERKSFLNPHKNGEPTFKENPEATHSLVKNKCWQSPELNEQ